MVEKIPMNTLESIKPSLAEFFSFIPSPGNYRTLSYRELIETINALLPAWTQDASPSHIP